MEKGELVLFSGDECIEYFFVHDPFKITEPKILIDQKNVILINYFPKKSLILTAVTKESFSIFKLSSNSKLQIKHIISMNIPFLLITKHHDIFIVDIPFVEDKVYVSIFDLPVSDFENRSKVCLLVIDLENKKFDSFFYLPHPHINDIQTVCSIQDNFFIGTGQGEIYIVKIPSINKTDNLNQKIIKRYAQVCSKPINYILPSKDKMKIFILTQSCCTYAIDIASLTVIDRYKFSSPNFEHFSLGIVKKENDKLSIILINRLEFKIF